LNGAPSDATSTPVADPTTPESSPAAPSGHLDRAGLVRAISVRPYQAGTAHMVMTMGGATTLTAEGDVRYLKSGADVEMTMSMPQMGSGAMEMRVVHGIVYMTIPQVTPPGKFLKIDPHDKSNPMSKGFASLSQQMDPLNSIKAMRTSVRKVRFVGAESVDGTDTDHYVVTVSLAALLTSMKAPSTAAMPRTVTYDMWLDGKDLLRRMEFELPSVKMDMLMSHWGEPVHISAPPAAKVADPSRLTG
jgi:hypothetical protein